MMQESLPNSPDRHPGPLVKIGALVVRDGRPKFAKPWVTLFECPALSRGAKAALLDLATRAARTRDGLLIGSLSDLDMPASSGHRALAELSREGLVYRRRGKVYLNPSVAYAGPVGRHEAALAAWLKLLEEGAGYGH